MLPSRVDSDSCTDLVCVDSFGFPTRFGRAPAQVSAFVSFPLLHSHLVALILTNHQRSERNSFFDQCVSLPSLSKRIRAVQLTFNLAGCARAGRVVSGLPALS